MNIKKIDYNEPVKIKRITIFKDGSGYISMECAGRIRMIDFSGKLEEGELSGNRKCSVNINNIYLGLLGTKDSYFPCVKDGEKINKEFYPDGNFGILDIFGMGVGVK